MEHSPQPPERFNPLLEQAELNLLFLAAANTLITKGQYESNLGVYTPEGRPESLLFMIPVDPLLIKEIFYPEDRLIEVTSEPDEPRLIYATPHALAEEEIEEQSSNIYLEFNAKIRNSGVTFRETYRIAVGEAAAGIYTSSVEHEYERDGMLVGEDTVEVDGTLILLTSEYRDIRFSDADKLRTLLGRL